MLTGAEVEGYVVEVYTEYHDAGELVCKFTLREVGENTPELGT